MTTSMKITTAKPAKPKRSHSRLLPAALAGVLATGWLAVAAFSAPLQTTERVTDQEIKVDVVFAQFVTPSVSTLYPEPKASKNEPFAYMRLLDRLDVYVDATMTASPAAELAGRMRIDVEVVAPERWSRTFELVPARTFQSEGSQAQLSLFNETMRLPAHEYAEFIATVEEETRITPREDYKIIVTPVVEVTATGALATVTEELEFPFTFRLAGNTLYADGPYDKSLNGRKANEVVRPGRFAIGGVGLPVMAARISAIVVTVFALGSFVWLLREWRREAAAVPELARILQRYRDRLVEAEADHKPSWSNRMTLSSFRDLLRLADQLDQTIFVMRSPGEVRFVVIDGENEYSFRPMPTDRTFPSKRVDSAMRSTQSPS